MRLGVVVPLANEETTVETWLTQVLSRLTSDDGIFCVVDNASRDCTRDCVAHCAEKDARVYLVWAPENRCVVDAYFRGYRAALNAGCQWILEMDGGFSHRPDEIPRFIAAMQQGYDYVGGCRFTRGGSHRGSWTRYLISKGGTWMANCLLGTRMKDMTGGFECFSRQALQQVVEHGVRSRAHFFQTEIKFFLRHWNWTEVPINYSNPSKSVGSSSLKEAFRNLWHLYRESRRTNLFTTEASEKIQKANV